MLPLIWSSSMYESEGKSNANNGIGRQQKQQLVREDAVTAFL
jgi:hypothetical protein